LWRRTVLAAHDRASIAGLAGLILLAGCSGPATNGPPHNGFGGLTGQPPQAGAATPVAAAPTPGPDKLNCGNTVECKVMLKTMIESPDRGWIGQRQPPDTYANGTRLFAYRALRKQLTCGELTLAVTELQAASKSLGGSVSGMTPDQVTRTRSLCEQVHGELAKERDGRCRAGRA
jgi:hypothetical protein